MTISGTMSWLRVRAGRLVHPAVYVLAIGMAVSEALIWRIGGGAPAVRDVLLVSWAWSRQSAYVFARLLDIVVPMAFLVPLLLEEWSLTARRRALWAAYGDSTGVRVLALGCLILAGAAATVLLAAGIPAAGGDGVRVGMALVLVVPTVAWLSGLMFLVAEGSRQPAVGLMVAVLWGLAAFLYGVIVHPPFPTPFVVLYLAGHYHPGQGLFWNRGLTLAGGVALWAAGGAVQAWNRNRGLDT